MEPVNTSLHERATTYTMGEPAAIDPPFEETYKNLFEAAQGRHEVFVAEEREDELPLIDLGELNRGEFAMEECKRKIARASREWGFFQVVNHGISREILDEMRSEQVKLFRKPFHERKFNFSTGSYRWGAPYATTLRQLSWSEAFHVPLKDISTGALTNLSPRMVQFATTLSELAQKLARILAEKVGHKNSTYFQETCLPTTCYVRMNRYPPCQISPNVFGLIPHTDSDFLTILHQDHIGGLQQLKDGKWVSVKPNPEALVVNLGDLFQAWSNGVYKSVEHRVVANEMKERFSTAFFLCPSFDTTIQSYSKPSLYKTFTFGEFRQQVQEDVKNFGYKVGLPRFLASTN